MRRVLVLFLMIVILMLVSGCALEDRDSALRTRIRQSANDLKPFMDDFSDNMKTTNYLEIQESARKLSDKATADDLQIRGYLIYGAWEPTKNNYLQAMMQFEQIGDSLKYCSGICGGDYENGARQKAMDEFNSGTDYMTRALDSLPQQEPSVIEKIFRPINWNT